MSAELEHELEAQAAEEETSKSRITTDLLNLLLRTPVCFYWHQSAKQNQQTVV